MLEKIRWSAEEDQLLLELVNEYKEKGLMQQDAEKAFVEMSPDDRKRTHHAVHIRVSKLVRQQKEAVTYSYTMEDVEHEVSSITTYIQALIQENARLKQELEDERATKADYESVVRILNVARKEALQLQETSDRTRFRMEPNGNLIRMEREG